MNRVSRIFLIIIIVLTSVGCDQATKAMASDLLQHSPSRSFLSGWIRFQYAENTGGFLSIGSELHPLLRTSVAIVVAFLVFFGLITLVLNAHKLNFTRTVGFALFLAGGCGNSIDRLTSEGRVTDFIVLGATWMQTGIFNLADVFITVGVVLALVGNVLEQKGKSATGIEMVKGKDITENSLSK